MTDSNDKVYLAGLTEGDLDGNGNAGSADIFLMMMLHHLLNAHHHCSELRVGGLQILYHSVLEQAGTNAT